jgi:hypothetical protein
LAATKAELDATYTGWQRALPRPVFGERLNPFTLKPSVGESWYRDEPPLDRKARLKVLSGLGRRVAKLPNFEMRLLLVEEVESLLEIVAGEKQPPLRPERRLWTDGEVLALPPAAKRVLAGLTEDDLSRCGAKLSKAVAPMGTGGWRPKVWAEVLGHLRALAKEARATRRSLYYEFVV